MAEIYQKIKTKESETLYDYESLMKKISNIIILDPDSSCYVEHQFSRDSLLQELHAIYVGAPSTTYSGYLMAQNALKIKKDMTFR